MNRMFSTQKTPHTSRGCFCASWQLLTIHPENASVLKTDGVDACDEFCSDTSVGFQVSSLTEI